MSLEPSPSDRPERSHPRWFRVVGVIFGVLTVVPAVMLGLICSNDEVKGARVMGSKSKVAYWAMVGGVVLTGLLTIPALVG